MIHLGHDPEEAVSVGGGGHNGSLIEGSGKVSGRAAPSWTHVDGIPEIPGSTSDFVSWSLEPYGL